MTLDQDFDWENCDACDGPRTVVLLGSGASADLGLPTANQLHEQLKERLGPLYSNLASLVFGTGAVDVERLFRVIEFIHTVETSTRDFDRRTTYDGVDVATLVEHWKPSVQEFLDGQLHTIQGSPTGLLIDKLWQELFDLLWLKPNQQPDFRYLRWLLMSMKGGTIATLNYDNSLESAASAGRYCAVDAGIYPMQRNARMVGFSDSKDAVRIIKLHGSLGWVQNPGSGEVSELDPIELGRRSAGVASAGRPPVPGIIFGAGNKLRPDGPYLDLYIEFKEALQQADRLIVIGYGWRDAHINELFRRWVQQDASERWFRLSRIDTRDFPFDPRKWPHDDRVQFQLFSGRAAETMVEMTKPTPGILRSR